MKRRVVFIVVASLLSSCALNNTYLYNSDRLPSGEQATVSAIGIFSAQHLVIQVTSVNGDPVDTLKTASFLLPPGVYRISLHAKKDPKISQGFLGLELTQKIANGSATVVAIAGHTYVPNGQIIDNRISFYMEDKGINYPTECLPLYQYVNGTSNVGAKLYATGKKCKI